eukprot:3133-Chlamydomonas_euryale.AAC.3
MRHAAPPRLPSLSNSTPTANAFPGGGPPVLLHALNDSLSSLSIDAITSSSAICEHNTAFVLKS